ncbi:abc transporter atp-binding protein [hydrocarbon metagenome]|uniref:Abc transporter atp-binding protein n=1 Tax=hydrocarbon metagenome TaxID=938273 RepID=A0A0W8FWH5_9ZZZZ
MNKILEVNNLSKDYNDATGFNVHLLEDISLEVTENSITTILAPAGAGKTSLLKILSGIESLTSGQIKINSANQRVVYIPSKPSSFPWYSVKQNISLVNRDDEKIKSIVEFVGLEGYEDHFPDNNSVGFRFRISLARALAVEPGIIILDEPFSKEIKPVTLQRLYELLLALKSKLGITFLLGTSNLSEAILLSDEIYIMQKEPGKIIDSVQISFDNERNVELMRSEKFIDYRNKIEELLKNQKEQSLSNITI